MDIEFNNIIHSKINMLVDFIITQNPSIDRVKINQKIKELNLRLVPKSKKRMIESITEKKDVIKVNRSPFSNYILVVDQDNPKFKDLKINTLVIDLESRAVIGSENSNGEIEPLTKQLIEICHKYKLKYIVPLNLETNNDLEEYSVIEGEMEKLGLNYNESEDEVDDE